MATVAPKRLPSFCIPGTPYIFFFKWLVIVCLLHSLYFGVDVELLETQIISKSLDLDCFYCSVIKMLTHQHENVIKNYVKLKLQQLHIFKCSYRCYLR